MLGGGDATRGTNQGEASEALISTQLKVVKLSTAIVFGAGKEGSLAEAFWSKHPIAFVTAPGRSSS